MSYNELSQKPEKQQEKKQEKHCEVLKGKQNKTKL